MFQKVTILILIDGFLQFQIKERKEYEQNVTILILIDGFLQYRCDVPSYTIINSHNPYFNRWFSAIRIP